ncbi:hypothetical protein [Streptomyces sp. NBC_00299]|uniref:hypothetical protein n=1 Tax=Streptomyces sp. NBC_00299 TaxID=2975705 RepID=UPI002E27F76D|nr:hypothetical protein [Streptomyces sp. NBC_00299]
MGEAVLDRARAAASARFASSCAGAELFDVERCTVTKAVGEIKPLLAARGFAAPHRVPAHRLTARHAVGDLGMDQADAWL